ncbi:TetR family transcriptional regulator [Streptomyces sp. SID3343]|uniref:TetR family transcriptional regulator n=1 Tax=Streptomyces sp. SID3343 TaxID=2690260 RepID=UPI001370DE34|nr:TetR family transcriptional regulator [Streptomyces sp. SID3343]MYV99074.1 TetR family transcriptional regulator [Streptomyces sp. SID3343]
MTGTHAGPASERGAGARLLMIEAAERLFAERGINGVSLREIGAQAGQRNTAAARYHFGSKETLVDAVFRHRMEPVNARRLAMLDELTEAGREHDVRGLVEAFLFPLAETLGEPGKPSWYLRFCVHAGFVAGTAARDLAREEWTRGIYTVRERLFDLNASLPPRIRDDRWVLLSSYLTHALADREMAMHYPGTRPVSDRDVFLAGLTDTAVALFLAPVSDRTGRLIEGSR